MDILTFALDSQPYAFRADHVVQVVQVVAIAPLAGAPPGVEGVVNVRGTMIPVFDLRGRFGLPERPIDPAQHLVILKIGARSAAVRVDSAEDFISIPDSDVTAPGALAEGAMGDAHSPYAAGVAVTPGGTMVIYDLAAFLTPSESLALEQAMVPRSG